MGWTVKPISALADYSDAWQALNRKATNSPLLDFRFARDLATEFARDSDVIASLPGGDGSVEAIGVFRQKNYFCWHTLQPANAPIGLWISRPGLDVQELLRALAPALSAQCGLVSLTQQDPDGIPRPETSPRLSTMDYIQTPSLVVPGSFAEFLKGRSKNFRHNLTRQRNRMRREGIAARLEFLSTPDAMAEAIRDYSALECAGWKGETNTAVRMDEPQGRFYVKVMSSFAGIGEALNYRYFFGDRLVASDLCLLRDGTLIILKTACDKDIQGLSTAGLMRIDAFTELFDRRGVRRVEFYGPLKEWHTYLTAGARYMYHINYYRWEFLKVLHEYRMGRRHARGVQLQPEDQGAAAGAAT